MRCKRRCGGVGRAVLRVFICFLRLFFQKNRHTITQGSALHFFRPWRLLGFGGHEIIKAFIFGRFFDFKNFFCGC